MSIPIKTAEEAEGYFPIIRLHREDLAEYWNDAHKLTDEQMQAIASKMGSNDAMMETFWVFINQLDDIMDFGELNLTPKDK